ncbi:hypothetical protein ACHAWO_013776 [Cyclotella atomus]|uniref:Uncharacterized protein n=1 Tax=Cyclotella atomus TaxID=382360 RepID=A0ABD3NAT7_9STRA
MSALHLDNLSSNHHHEILRIQIRRKHSEASGSSQSPSDYVNSKSPSIQDDSRKSPSASQQLGSTNANRKSRFKSKRKTPFSPINLITTNHPKNTSPPTQRHNALLTRKQLQRLTPKQRVNHKRHLIERQKASRTILDQARTNVRSNLKYLKGSAESNLKKNIDTMKRLFKGEEVWKEEPIESSAKSKSTTNTKTNANTTTANNESSELNWENLPNALQTSLKSNLSNLQNYLHKLTDGAIPSPSTSFNSSSSNINSSIATRLQYFHRKKTQDAPLVMDNYWIAWNVLLALTPGFLVHLYCLSLQDEMKEFYDKLEQKERERVLGNGDKNGSGGMGVSSALVTEEGVGTWEKIKMAVNDLFFGGIEDKINMVGGNSQDSVAVEIDAVEQPADVTDAADGATASATDANRQSEQTEASNNVMHRATTNDKDATIETLLQRIQALEKQVGIQQISNDATHERPVHKSPIRNRRDDHILSEFQKLNGADKNPTESTVKDEALLISTIQTVTDAVDKLMKLDVDSVKDWVNCKCMEIVGHAPFTVSADEKSNSILGKTTESNDDTSNKSTETASQADGATKQEAIASVEKDSDINANNEEAEIVSSFTAIESPSPSRWRRWSSWIRWRRKDNDGKAEEG